MRGVFTRDVSHLGRRQRVAVVPGVSADQPVRPSEISADGLNGHVAQCLRKAPSQRLERILAVLAQVVLHVRPDALDGVQFAVKLGQEEDLVAAALNNLSQPFLLPAEIRLLLQKLGGGGLLELRLPESTLL